MMFPPMFVAGRPPELTWLHGAHSATNATSYTFSSVPFGVEHSSRLIIVALSTLQAVTVTVSGVSASRVAYESVSGQPIEIWQAAVPSGTSGSIVVAAGPTAASRGIIEVWSLLYAKSSTAVATDGDLQVPTAATASFSVPARGVFVAFAISNGASPALSGVTTDHTGTVEIIRYSAGSGSVDTTGTVTITANDGGSIDLSAIVAAAWR